MQLTLDLVLVVIALVLAVAALIDSGNWRRGLLAIAVILIAIAALPIG